jgi:hypothetical protein
VAAGRQEQAFKELDKPQWLENTSTL